jgi:hypothetical protein
MHLSSVDPDLEGPDFIIRQQIFGKMLTDHKAMVRVHVASLPSHALRTH